MAIDRRAFILNTAAFSTLLAMRPDLTAVAQTAEPRAGRGADWFFLTDAEARTLTAMVDHMIPAYEFASGSDAGVVAFLDLQLATDYGEGAWLFLEGPFEDGKPEQGYQLPYPPAELFRKALGAFDAQARGFANLTADNKERVLKQLADGDITLDGIPGKTFFDEFYAAVIQGYFADPIHNGNSNMSSWRMIGFPGPNAYYLTEVDRYNMDYRRPPSSIAHVAGSRATETFRPPGSEPSHPSGSKPQSEG
jgi:gluconate 2-dehydrogenase gamma chain